MSKEKILFLGPEDSPLFAWFKGENEKVIQVSHKIDSNFIDKENFYFLVSYGYRHIIKKEILDKFPDRAVNLHISYLPWNRGADPNFWSFADNTPKGVTIHYLDEGVDTGDIIVQEKVNFDSNTETLATSYSKLQTTIQELFKENWNKIKNNTCPRQKQVGQGTLHKTKDKKPFLHLLTDGWNTPVSELKKYFEGIRKS
mgnify:CR=1 FL=1